MGDLLKVGFSVKQALSFSMTLMPQYSEIFRDIDNKMASGKLFANSVRGYVGQDIYYQLLIAEQHGDLRECISQLGRFLTVNVQQKNKLNGLLQYPIILLGLLVILLCALKIFVFPELSQWQNDQSIDTGKLAFLPWMIGGFVTGILLIVIVLIYKWSKTSTMNKVTLLCQLPVIGKMYRQYYGYYLVTNFALLLENGMGINEICHTFAQFDHKSLLRQLSYQLDLILNNGEEPAKIIHRYPYLPQELIIFLNKGETVENIGKQLTVFSKLLFERLIKSIEQLLVLVQPILFGIIAVVIVAMYLSIMLPIYQSMKGIY